MTHPESPSEAPRLPVVYVHAMGRRPASPGDIEALLELGCPVCSRSEGAGSVRTANGLDQPGPLLQELAERFPGRPVAIVRAGLKPNRQQLTELCAILDSSEPPLALTLLSNRCPALNPFAGLRAPADELAYEPEELVRLLAPGYLHAVRHWVEHFAVLSAGAVQRVAAQHGDGTLMQRLAAAGGRLAAPDHLFLYDREFSLFAPRALQPHESLYPPPFGDLSARLQKWMDAGIDELPFSPFPDQPATLHVTHNWGGGIAHWISTFIDADGERASFQLRAESPQADQGCGQRLSLYAGNELRCPVASWWLQPPIRSVEDSEPAYREVLDTICHRYRVGRIIVSSLIGHGLDVLRTGIPTLQILHDHFPLWPLLSVHPEPFLRESRSVDLESALASQGGKQEFTDKDAEGWSSIRKAYLKALSEFPVRIAAPGQSVLDIQARLEPEFDWQAAQIVPHGTSIVGGQEPVAPRRRTDGRLRMVVLGRIQAGKGQKLLLEAVGALSSLVQVYLLGSGQSGEQFFGSAGVDVIVEYERDELPDILRAIGPHFAALISIVPETFSYTLSELQLLGIPVIATRVGSFTERIVHGQSGWLIDPDPRSLVDQVAALCRTPAEIENVRSALPGVKVHTAEDMISTYNRMLPAAVDPGRFVPADPDESQIQFAASDYQLTLTRQALEGSTAQRKELQRELEERTQWALDTKQQLRREHQVRRDAERSLAAARTSLAELESLNRHLSSQNAEIQGSLSWRITRPFRVLRRLAGNLVAAGAWNPANWPRLLSEFGHNRSSLGLRGALMRWQATGADIPEPEHRELAAPVTEARPPESFPRFEKPDASIVIPVYNNWPYTAACLEALADTAGKYSFEVIVIDDGSVDESEEMLTAIDGLTYIRNERNIGFVGSCNRGAEQARGEFLVMLNNDTQVLEGWLDELIDTLKREPGAGLVGARLLYPDGRLQESGGIIFSDGSGWNYGRDDHADKPDYCFMREADYCSGACIAMETAFFRQLGGFDERYAPAYYEDTDLAFRVREAGFKVLVQPASSVVHHEGITSGTDTSAGVKQFQCINQDKFVYRWREELKSQPQKIFDPAGGRALQAASQHRARGRILWIGTVSQDSGECRISDLLKCCRKLGYAVTFLAHGGEPDESRLRDLQRSGVEVLSGRWLKALPDFFHRRGSGFEIVAISHHDVAAEYRSWVKRHCKDSRFVFDTANSRFRQEKDTALRRADRLVRHSELSLVKVADAALVADPAEKKALEEEAPGIPVFVFAPLVPETDDGNVVSPCASLARLFDSFAAGAESGVSPGAGEAI